MISRWLLRFWNWLNQRRDNRIFDHAFQQDRFIILLVMKDHTQHSFSPTREEIPTFLNMYVVPFMCDYANRNWLSMTTPWTQGDPDNLYDPRALTIVRCSDIAKIKIYTKDDVYQRIVDLHLKYQYEEYVDLVKRQYTATPESSDSKSAQVAQD